MTNIIRVFPRRTKATPNDSRVRIGTGPGFFDEADEVHISVTFTWDLPEAERLVKLWQPIAPVRIGGPATGKAGGDFEPGVYLKPGYVITSRGCPNNCWFCSVWKRDGKVMELPVRDGWKVQDDNLLACSENHIKAVFAMLAKQKSKPEFTGGLEAARLQLWQALALRELHPKQIFFAYDTPDDLTPLQQAGQMLKEAGFILAPQNHDLRCYVLIGGPKDNQDAAALRMKQTMDAGFTPMAMLWRNQQGKTSPDWRKFQRLWARPALIYHAEPKFQLTFPDFAKLARKGVDKSGD